MSSFVDHVRIRVAGGSGGRGSASFRRTKQVARGGPDGGDGGRGGSVVVVAEVGMASLARYVRRRFHRAADGLPGGANNRTGANGADITLPVPVGTVVRDATGGEMLADLARAGARFVAAHGGKGGRGNASMRSQHDRVPNYAEHGEEGEDLELDLELHLVADVGLVGPPNAGKSTLLGAVSRASPKVADYPFTTIEPGLGVVAHADATFVLADLPGLIEGASAGKGLGLRFLRHADRCGVLAAVVDLAAPDPLADLEAVAGEVESYDPALAARLRVVVGNKTDLSAAKTLPVAEWAQAHDKVFVPVSAAQGSNLAELILVLAAEVERARVELGEPETFITYRPVVEDRVVVAKEDGAFRVSSQRAERAIAQTPLDNPKAVRRLQRRLRALGVESALKKHGAQVGDEVRIGEVAFEFIPEEA